MSEMYSKQNRNKTKVKTLKHSSSPKKAKLALSAGKVFISVCLLKSQTITKKSGLLASTNEKFMKKDLIKKKNHSVLG
jgi:hypothetical protein